MRALIVTNMYPSRERPAHGIFVRDQVEALRRLPDLDVDVFAFAPGTASAYLRAAAELRGHERYDVVHAHFGLTAWPALAVSARRRVVTLHGTDLAHPRSRAITLGALRFYHLVAAVSEPLARTIPGWATRRPPAVLPCGVAIDRFRRIDRSEARTRLGLHRDRPHLLFPAAPARPEKRFDRAAAVAGEALLLSLGSVDPAEVALWINAANAVVVPSEREGFGLAVLEALACDVPVLATPVGVAPEALAGVGGCYCGPFDAARWSEELAPHLANPDPRVAGRATAQRYGSDVLALRVAEAWRALL